ncbi:integral membrane [Moniliophthora roreri MCA 2997]|uniref:Integral membrane n=2 Tax=Moniliophthora roreri TaxID=221103 RepID=V2X6X2_MONRO|nr:integral membrane [Moniliophthora roreri MCA 2997]KAI3618285.1 integral membrane [Moniliophthora roreri]
MSQPRAGSQGGSRNGGQRRQPSRAQSRASVASDAEPAPRPQRRRGGKNRNRGQKAPETGIMGLPPLAPEDMEVAPKKEWPPPMTDPLPGYDSFDEAIKGRLEQDDEGMEEVVKLRLEVNLDVVVTLRATVHGDLTVSLLGE